MRLSKTTTQAIVILAIGCLIGGVRLWRAHKVQSQLAASAQHPIIVLVAPGGQTDWLQVEAQKFNKDNPGHWQVLLKFSESRAALKAILAGTQKATLWCPASSILIPHGAKPPLYDRKDPLAYRVLPRTPLVFVTTKEKSDYLKQVLGGRTPWSSLRKLMQGRLDPPWGAFECSLPDPRRSDRGLLTLALCQSEFARIADITTMEQLADDADFAKYLHGFAQGTGNDILMTKSPAALDTVYFADQMARDLIVTEESVAMTQAQKNHNLVVIYPKPTVTAERPICLIERPWVLPEERDGARAFVKFLGTAPAIKDSITYNLRPVASKTGPSLTPKLKSLKDQGFQVVYSETKLPSYKALSAASVLWKSPAKSH